MRLQPIILLVLCSMIACSVRRQVVDDTQQRTVDFASHLSRESQASLVGVECEVSPCVAVLRGGSWSQAKLDAWLESFGAMGPKKSRWIGVAVLSEAGDHTLAIGKFPEEIWSGVSKKEPRYSVFQEPAVDHLLHVRADLLRRSSVVDGTEEASRGDAEAVNPAAAVRAPRLLN